MLLDELREKAMVCRRCDLANGRTHVVFGSGNPKADVMFVGEAPGYHEDREGEPFVGAAGQLLSRLLESIGLSRADVYIANVLKCRPPENRDPTTLEVETCKPYLLRQIEIISPRIVGALGNFATRVLTGRRTGVTKLRGEPIQIGNFFVLPMLHPAAALHRGSFQSSVEEDFQFLKNLLAADLEPEPRPEQIDLF
ncbi:MAG: uracil-DNA glycosylase [Candidatus Eisenbacteria sp.]|nr:uracil-DNA glycosylase [Candidatus Eisenbacteria bacterium]